MPRQAEFADFSVSLKPLPDETLFSWCSRYHRLAANGIDRTTCLQLFGHHRIGTAHDFPARLGTLAARTGGSLGAAVEIVHQRTLLPFYLPFRSLVLGQQAVESLCGQGIGHIKYRLGLLTSGLGAAHPLKACPACVHEDMNRHGWAFWRRSHQLPGVWLCSQHHVSLQISPLKLGQAARYSWVLPTLAGCAPVACLEEQERTCGQAAWLRKLGALCVALLDCAPGGFDNPIRIGLAVRDRLKVLGLTHPGGRVRWSKVDPILKEMAMNLACLPEFNHQTDPALLHTQLLRLLSGRALTHPLRYMVWIAAWFADLDDFQKGYVAADVEVLSTARHKVNKLTSRHGPNELQQHALFEACQGRISLTKAAKQAGVSYATMAAWVSNQAVEPSRRPKKLISSLWEHVVNQLRNGADKKTVAQASDVSVVTVTRVLRTVPGLQDHWHAIRHEQRRAIARQAWEEVAGLYACMGVKALRRLQPAAYAWLYRNDPDWLKACGDRILRLAATNNAAKRIENADARMASALQKQATLSGGNQAWTLDSLKRSFPRIEKAIRFPERWPQTVKTLAFILSCTVH